MSIDRRHFLTALVAVPCAARYALAAVAGEDSNWSGWRGPTRDGMATADPWPSSLDENHLQRLWSVSLDAGYSGPIIDRQRVYLTETRDKKSEFVSAYDRNHGEKVWESSWPGSMSVPFFAKSNGDWIRSTPTTDGQHLFIAGMRDVLVCLRADNGDESWRKDFMAEYSTPLPDFGFVSSPLLDEEYLYVQAGGGLIKLQKENGRVEWRVLVDGGGMNGSAFSSPVLATLHGRRMLIVQTRTTLFGIDPADGSTIWSKTVEAFRGMNILTPTIWNDQIFTSSYGGKSWLFGFEPQDGQPWNVVTRWENKSQGYMSSPLVIDRHLYLHLRNQRLTCIDLESGEENWTTKPFGKYWSMISNGKQILALDERGKLYLIEANPNEYQLIDDRQVTDEEAWSHLALSGNQLFVRDLKGLTVFQWS